MQEPANCAEKVHFARGFDVAMRPMQSADANFILNAWMQSYRTSGPRVPGEVYFAGQQNLISELSRRRRIVIAADRDQPTYIYGFACGKRLSTGQILLDYVYVKKLYRKRGVGRDLIAELGFADGRPAVATHLTPAVRSFCEQQQISYNPYYNVLGYSDV